MWTPGALSSEARPLAAKLWRVVEAQHSIATARLTDSLEEQAILEDLIEETKPSIPESCAGLHFLLATPFRYAPYPHGSRFRRARQREGAFYASEHLATAVAEIAFLRLLFLAESPAMRPPERPIPHTAFTVPCRSNRMIDLTLPPLARDSALWREPIDYSHCQVLADAARKGGLEAIRYRSVRDPEGRHNVALLSPGAFAAKAPETYRSWRVFPRATAVQAWCEFPSQERYEFTLADFAADPRIRSAPGG